MNFNYISLLLFLPSVAKKKKIEREKKEEEGEGTVARKLLNNSNCEGKGEGGKRKFFHYVSKSQKSEKGYIYNISMKYSYHLCLNYVWKAHTPKTLKHLLPCNIT